MGSGQNTDNKNVDNENISSENVFLIENQIIAKDWQLIQTENDICKICSKKKNWSGPLPTFEILSNVDLSFNSSTFTQLQATLKLYKRRFSRLYPQIWRISSKCKIRIEL